MSIGKHVGEHLGSLYLVTAQVTDEPVNDVWSGWGSVIFVLGITMVVALVVAMLIWQVFRTRQATIESRAPNCP